MRFALAACIVVSSTAMPLVVRATPGDVTCEDARIRVQGRVADRWLAPIADACERLATRRDTDESAHIRIVPSKDDVVIEATTRDGRTAIRRVREPESLATSLEALLVLPVGATRPATEPSEPGAAPPSPPRATPANTAAAVDVAGEAPRSSDPERRAIPEPSATFEIGGALAGRVAGPFASIGPSIIANLAFGSWLIGVDARWDVDQRKSGSPSGFEMETVGAGLALARRFRFGFGDLDAGIAPRLVVEIQSLEDATREETYSATDVRLAGLVRASFGRGAVRFFTMLDTELAPSRLRRSVRLAQGFPALPAWSAGLSLGVSWGAR